LTTVALVKEKDSTKKQYQLNRKYEIDLDFTLEAESYNWFVIE
jgi:hypothetical protein